MAGGMQRGAMPALRDRRPSGHRAQPEARHCWADPPGHPGPWPGLVVEWRRGAGGSWNGRCVYAIDDPDGSGVRLVERWLPADCLTPVEGASRP
jgi:hypothetical protein